MSKMTALQFTMKATLVLFVRKGLITEKEMDSYYDEVLKVYYNNDHDHEKIIEKLLKK